MQNPKLQKLGPLEVLHIPAKNSGSYVVVFHGFGADAFDLLSLSHLLTVPPGTGWVFAQAPFKIEEFGVAGRAWFPLDVVAMDNAARQGRTIDYSAQTPEGLKKARGMIVSMLQTLQVPSSNLVLMGFSQGAMMATDVALGWPEKIAGLVILSGTLLNSQVWKQKALTKVGLPFFQSHGQRDPLLGIDGAKNLELLLKECGLKGQLHIFDGGHEVPQEIIHKASQFTKTILTPQN